MFTVILHDAPYTTDRRVRACASRRKRWTVEFRSACFYSLDAVNVARKGQCPLEGAPNLEDLLIRLLGKGASVSVCTTCVEAGPYRPSDHSGSCFFHTKESGLGLADLVTGVKRGTMGELVGWCRDSQHVVSF